MNKQNYDIFVLKYSRVPTCKQFTTQYAVEQVVV